MGEVLNLRGVPVGPAPALPQGQVADLLAFYSEFPGRWQQFLRAHFAGVEHVAAFFGVSERAAGKWWEGAGGVNGAKVALACAKIPTAAPMLFAAE